MNTCPILGCHCHENTAWDRSCPGCARSLLAADWSDRLCSDCRESLIETVARKIDPSYDALVMHEWKDTFSILHHLYPGMHETCCSEKGWQIRFIPPDRPERKKAEWGAAIWSGRFWEMVLETK